ncbi:MAG: DNA repair protein RecO [Clostridiaceae bacterium]|jgi:DNA repair protein RecO (recombination protein O)|nr:DNA repair protein RecO [Clostridiaceae bacterium]
MGVIKTKGLVIKEVSYDDSDKMLTLITEDLGKISVLARNAKKSGSRTSYGTQVLTFGEYVLFKGRTSFTMNSCDVLINYYNLATDLTCFTHAAHMMDMAGDAAIDSILSADILNLLIYGLQALKKGRSPLLVSSSFALKLMQITGYPPHVCSCAACSTGDIEQIYFSYKHNGFICENCSKQDKEAVAIDIGTAKGIMYVLCACKGGAYNFELSGELLDTFSKIAFRYISQHLDKNYKKLDILNEF